MDATVIRRYLQPSPTLRWHPWAPLAAAVLLLAFVFYLGALWGYTAAQRERSRIPDMTAGTLSMRYLIGEKSTARELMFEAQALDRAVHSAVSYHPAAWEEPLGRFEHALFRGGRYFDISWPQYAASVARTRLKELSPANPRWQATSTYCLEAPRLEERDFPREYASLARDYSEALGREVRPEELAPAVPGFKCSAAIKVQP